MFHKYLLIVLIQIASASSAFTQLNRFDSVLLSNSYGQDKYDSIIIEFRKNQPIEARHDKESLLRILLGMEVAFKRKLAQTAFFYQAIVCNENTYIDKEGWVYEFNCKTRTNLCHAIENNQLHRLELIFPKFFSHRNKDFYQVFSDEITKPTTISKSLRSKKLFPSSIRAALAAYEDYTTISGKYHHIKEWINLPKSDQHQILVDFMGICT